MKVIIIIFTGLIILVTPVFSQLSPEKAWAISLTGIMSEANRTSLTTLQNAELTPEFIAQEQAMIKRDWGINNRTDLLATLDNMEKNGHAAELENIKRIIKSNSDFSFSTIIINYNLNQKQYNYLKFTLANWKVFENRSILVWDLGRNIALCRWGFECGYLTEDEAWEKILYFSKKIKPMYKSWKDYGYDYYLGRVFWASGFGDEINYAARTSQIYIRLISEGGDWYQKNWDDNVGNIDDTKS